MVIYWYSGHIMTFICYFAITIYRNNCCMTHGKSDNLSVASEIATLLLIQRRQHLFKFPYSEVLPLVEFFLEEDITDEEAVLLLDSEPPRKKEKDEWKESAMGSILLKLSVEKDKLGTCN